MPDPSLPKTFEDYLRAFMERGRNQFRQITVYGRDYGLVLTLPKGNGSGEDEFSVDGNTVAPLTEPKGG